MICPYCNNEMEAGYIAINTHLGYSRIKWSESGKISRISKNGRKGENLPQTGILGRKVRAYRCMECRRIIIKY